MCEFPHNPPVLCIEGKVIDSKPVKHSKFKCLITLNSKKIIRPSGSYFFNKNLDKVTHKKNEVIKKDKMKFYSFLHCSSKNLITTLEYNCSDKYKDIKDLALIDIGQKKGNVLDQWTEKKHFIDCQSLLSN
jgi:hypothetical protein